MPSFAFAEDIFDDDPSVMEDICICKAYTSLIFSIFEYLLNDWYSLSLILEALTYNQLLVLQFFVIGFTDAHQFSCIPALNH